MKFLPTPRLTFLALTLACVGMMLTAILYFQGAMELDPCPLCITQRVFVIAVGVIAFIGFIHNPQIIGRRIYAGLALIMAVIGAGVSARHMWLQSLPKDQVPACGPGLSYLFDTFPLFDALKLLFQGDGNCADIQWSLLGLSIPGWTFVGFTGLALVALIQVLRKE